jgi:SAM-dependent methyltransferase
MKQTGERPLKDSTPSALLALHDAGYREVKQRLTDGFVLDIGCGVGDESIRLAGPNRTVLGVDYDLETAHLAQHQGVGAVCGDGSVLPFKTGSVDAVCSSHIIEHFVDPSGHVAEMARVVKDDGAVYVLTPNEPADFENPYHVHLFQPEQLRSMLDTYFEDVVVHGLDGDETVRQDFAKRRRTGKRILALDFLKLRHRLPRSWFVALHSLGRRVVYPVLAKINGPSQVIGEDRFAVTSRIDTDTLVLFAVARSPRR